MSHNNESINFYLSLWKDLASFCIVANILLASPSSLNTFLQLLDSTVFIPISKISMSNSEQSNIAIIGTVAFLCTSKLLYFSNSKLCLYSLDIQANSTKLAEVPNLSNVPFKYYEFTDVFSKTKAKVLTPYYTYDLKINLEEDAQSLVGSIYSFKLKRYTSQVGEA